MKNSYKTRGRGFTLIELLAVLVVLAILALIAIPIVIKVINNAREDSYKRSIESYARTAELAVAQWGMKNPGEAFPTNLRTYKDITDNYTIETKGDQVVCQEMDVTKEGKIRLGKCLIYKNGKDISEKTLKTKEHYFKYENNIVDEDGEYNSGEAPTQSTYEEYNVGDTFTFGGAGYHVIAESGIDENYVVALKDEPLTSDEIINLGFTSARIENGYGMVYYDDTEPKSINYEISEIKKVVDEWSAKLPSGVQEARLIKFEELQNNLGYDEATWIGSFYNVNSSTTPSWVYNSEYSYWTMNNHMDSDVSMWTVRDNGKLESSSGLDVNPFAIRPVINVLKSSITRN